MIEDKLIKEMERITRLLKNTFIKEIKEEFKNDTGRFGLEVFTNLLGDVCWCILKSGNIKKENIINHVKDAIENDINQRIEFYSNKGN